MMAENPFDQFDPPQQTGGNPFDRFDAVQPAARSTAAPITRESQQAELGKMFTPSATPAPTDTESFGDKLSAAPGRLWEAVKGIPSDIAAIPHALSEGRQAAAKYGELAFKPNPTPAEQDWMRQYSKAQATGVAESAAIGAPETTPNAAVTPSTQRLADLQASNITPTAPTVTGSRSLGTIAKTIGDVPLAGEPVTTRALQNIEEAAQQSRNIAGGYGEAGLPEEGGAALQAGRRAFQYGPEGAPTPTLRQAVTTPTRDIGFVPKSEQLYRAIPIEAGAPAVTTNTVQALRDVTSRFPSNPELGATLQNPVLSRWADALENGNGLTWDELRNFRSYVGQQLRQPADQLGVGRDEMRNLYGAVSNDIRDTAAAEGPDALKAFNRANNYYSAGLSRLNDAMGFIQKADSPEKAYYGLTRMGSEQGKGASIDQLTAVMKSLPDEMKGDVASTVINRMGDPTGNAKGANPSNFSVGTWATNYANISDKAKDALFGTTGTAQRDSLDTLSRAMTSLKNVERLGNPSRSGSLLITSGALAGARFAPLETALSAAATYGGAQALMSPKIARWLASMSKATTPEGWSNGLARLKAIAVREPIAQQMYGALTSQPQQ